LEWVGLEHGARNANRLVFDPALIRGLHGGDELLKIVGRYVISDSGHAFRRAASRIFPASVCTV
jgi:hypothetical protein